MRSPSILTASFALLSLATLIPRADASPRGFGITSGGQLFSFDLNRPSAAQVIGVPAGAGFKGLATRPPTPPATTPVVYALQVGALTSQLFTVNLTTGALTTVGSPIANAGTVGPTAYVIDPVADYGLAFNPQTLQPDASLRLRLVNSSGLDLRLNSDTGAIAAVDGTLQYSGGVPATVAVSGASYLNSETARAPGTLPNTQLFYLETANDNLVTFVPPADPNLGIFTTVGPLGVDVGANTGFDIFSGNGLNKGFITVQVAGGSNVTFHPVNLATGTAGTALGTFPADLQPSGGFAIVDVPDPALPVGTFGFSYNAAGQLFYFPITNPAAAAPIGAPVGPAVRGLDFLPGSPLLYTIDVGATTSQLSTVSVTTGSRTPVGGAFANVGTVAGNGYSLDPAASYGFDFNPTTLQTDGSVRIRLVNSAGQDLRLNSSTGQIASVDGALGYVGGTPATAAISAAAYTNGNDVRLPATGSPTQLYYLDTLNDNLVNLPGDPNSGQFAPVGPLGVDVAVGAGFDLLFNGGLNHGFIVVEAGGVASLHRINLITGAASAAIGTFPTGFEPVAGIAVAVIPGFVPGVDTLRPSVRITEPQRLRSTTNRGSLLVRGTASDDDRIDFVEVKSRGSVYRRANGTTTWRRSVLLEPGRNVIRARATDAVGNRSRVRKVIILREVPPSAPALAGD